ncbi:MAG TPA: phospholipid carrier-dependent glycosyltransferase, partial [Polyangiaceae bacterium]|nr:phospholipid carrier-dependent glycosyltransferase [Polyangiaceae bacterium]
MGEAADTVGPSERRTLARELADFISGRAPHRFLMLLVAASLPFLFWGIRHDSPTEDEWAHLTRGISYWQNSDMRIHVQHPPLANAIAGLPSAFSDNPDMTEMETWKDGYAPGLEYIKLDYPRAREQLAQGRTMMAVFYVGLVVYVFYFCLSFFGWPTAAAAAILVAFNPTVLGQARYVTTDMPIATMATIATGELARYLSRPGRLGVVTLGFALAGVVLSKHSGVLFVAITLIVALVAALLGKGRFSVQPSVLRRLALCLGHYAIAGIIVLFSINAIYKFDQTAMTVEEILETPEPKHWTTKRSEDRMLEEHSPLPLLPASFRIPLPYPYLAGLFGVREQDRMGYPSYFMGNASRHGHVAYFPVLLILKNPPGLLFLFGLGTALVALPVIRGLRRRERPTPLRLGLVSGCFLAVGGAFLLFIMRSSLNMGVRHALPIIPLASVLAGRAFALAGEVFSGKWLLGARAF